MWNSTDLPDTRRRALLVEDNPSFERLVGGAVARLGPDWQVQCCRSGMAALDAIEDAQARFDLALVDVGLPDMSGIEVIRAVRRNFPATPILVASVIATEETVLAAIRAGARGYILKDESETTIARALGQVLAGQYPISPSLARCLFRLAGAPGTVPDGERITLSPKEGELLRLLARGHTYAEAAATMQVALSTVQTHVRNLYRKLDAQSKVEAVSCARDRGLL